MDPQPQSKLPDPSQLRPDQHGGDRVAALVGRLQSEQNLVLGIVAGLGAAVVGAALWALITILTNFQIGFMAVGVGFLVGLAVRMAGKGVDPVYGVIGAGFAFLGCALGNLLSACSAFASDPQINVGFMEVVTNLTPGLAIELLKAWTQPIDFLFYALAVYLGYKYAFRQLSEEEVGTLI